MNISEIKQRIQQILEQTNGDLAGEWIDSDRILAVRTCRSSREAVDARLEIQLLLNQEWNGEQPLRLMLDISEMGTTVYSRREADKKEVVLQVRDDAYLALVIPKGPLGDMVRHQTASAPRVYKDYRLFYEPEEAVSWLQKCE